MPAGNYHLRYEQNGYALHRPSLQFVGSGTHDAGDPGIYPMATWQVESVDIEVVSENEICLEVCISCVPGVDKFREFDLFHSLRATFVVP